MVPVDLSGLIFVALALVWALVLIPKALRNHDADARTRTVDATSDSARVIARRSTPVAEPVASRVDPRAARAKRRELARSAARRRRRVLAVLLLVTAGLGATSVAGLTLAWAPAFPAAVVVGFLALARVLVRREHAAWDALLVELGGAAEATTHEPAAEEPVGQPELAVVARNDQGVAVVSDQEDTSSLDVSVLRQAATQLWDPLPMTLPTYVDKPRATRSVRTIDLAGAGVASSGHDAAASALVAEAATLPQQHEPPEQRAVGS